MLTQVAVGSRGNIFVIIRFGGFLRYLLNFVILEVALPREGRRLHSHLRYFLELAPVGPLWAERYGESNMQVREHESLKKYTTFRVSGDARYFFDVSSPEELQKAFQFIKTNNLPFFILGEGSNTLFKDGFFGAVVKISILGVKFIEGKDIVCAEVGAGEGWDLFVEQVVLKNLWGVENLSFIPGSVGAAPIQNIGAYGAEAKGVIQSVEIFDTKTLTVRTLLSHECEFVYRGSIFKTEEGRDWVVTKVIFTLKKEGQPNLSYKDTAEYFKSGKNQPTLQNVRKAIIEIRSRKLPNVKDIGTAGSFFKNPVVSKQKYEELQSRYPEVPGVLVDDSHIKIPAGWLFDHIGHFKGLREGNVGVWEKQALVLVNFGEASGEEIISLAKKMQKKIKDETGIELEPEVVIV